MQTMIPKIWCNLRKWSWPVISAKPSASRHAEASCVLTTAALGTFLSSAGFLLFCSNSVRNSMYVAAIHITSVLDGRFSHGNCGISSRKFSMCEFKAWTLLLSRAFAILRRLLTPDKRGDRRLVFFRIDGFFSFSWAMALPVFLWLIKKYRLLLSMQCWVLRRDKSI